MERLFTEACAFPYHELITKVRIGFPTVRIEAQFQKAVAYGEVLELIVDVINVSRRSVTFNYKLVGSDRNERAQARMVHVAMSLDSMTSIDIPDNLRERLNGLLSKLD